MKEKWLTPLKGRKERTRGGAGELKKSKGKERRFGMRYEFRIKFRYVDLRLREGRNLDLSF